MEFDVDYQSLLPQDPSAGVRAAMFAEELPHLCAQAYLAASTRPCEIVQVRHETFVYVFDNFQALEARGVVPHTPTEDSRLILAYGTSVPRPRARDDYRLRGLIGPTNTALGKAWDKGHFIGHALGGAVDRLEINVFIQRRDINRGWSEHGKRFRALEQYCVDHAGTFCFARPLYADGFSRPAHLDFGLVDSDGTLRVERFPNT
jgi:hypothetical protein